MLLKAPEILGGVSSIVVWYDGFSNLFMILECPNGHDYFVQNVRSELALHIFIKVLI